MEEYSSKFETAKKACNQKNDTRNEGKRKRLHIVHSIKQTNSKIKKKLTTISII